MCFLGRSYVQTVFKKNKVCELTSSVFYSSLCLFRRNNYTFGVVSLGRLWNILYEKEPLKHCFTELRRKAAVFLCQNLIMRCYVTILAEIYDDPTFFGSSPGFVNRTQSDPGFVNTVRSGPGFVNPIQNHVYGTRKQQNVTLISLLFLLRKREKTSIQTI